MQGQRSVPDWRDHRSAGVRIRARAARATATGLATVLLLVACGSTGGTADESTEAEEAGGAAEDTPESGSELSGELVIWDWQSGAWGDVLEELNASFLDEHPDVTIERVLQPFNEYSQLVQAANAGRSGPDVMMLLPGGDQVLSFASALTPLNDRIDGEMRDSLDGWESVSQDFDPDNAIVAVPVGLQGMVYWYNKAVFEEAGLDPEQTPGSHDELVSTAEELAAAGVVPLAGGDADNATSLWMFSLVWPAVGTPEDGLAMGRGELLFTDPLVEEAAELYVGLVEQDFFAEGFESLPLSPDALDSFKAGEQAMSPGLASEFYSFPDLNEALGEENAGVFLPVGQGGEPNYLPAGPAVAWAIPQYSEQTELAWEYIRHVSTDPDNVLAQFEGAGMLPNLDTVELPDDVPVQVPQLVEWYAEGETQLPVHQLWPAAVANEYGRQMALVLAGDIELDAALEAVAAVQEQQGAEAG